MLVNMTTRNQRKSLTGTVSSVSGSKSIKVTYDYKVRHPLYNKEVKRKTVIHAHDESAECGLGDRVRIVECRPISKLKRFRVLEVVSKAPIID